MEDKILRLKKAINEADSILIGAGAGLSTSSGYIYDGERFNKYFFDMKEAYHIKDMYSGAFYPYKSQEEFWGFFSRIIYVNRYLPEPKPIHELLLSLIKDKNYFVITTNCDHIFQRAGFSKDRLFYTQGDYGNIQCKIPCKQITVDNEEIIKKMIESQGFVKNNEGYYDVPQDKKIKLTIDSSLIPHCQFCGGLMTYHLRSDSKFVEDDGWKKHSKLYHEFVDKYSKGKILFLELGVGYNTPGIIKYPFWKMTFMNNNALYASINLNEPDAPEELGDRAICIGDDIGKVIEILSKK